MEKGIKTIDKYPTSFEAMELFVGRNVSRDKFERIQNGETLQKTASNIPRIIWLQQTLCP